MLAGITNIYIYCPCSSKQHLLDPLSICTEALVTFGSLCVALLGFTGKLLNVVGCINFVKGPGVFLLPEVNEWNQGLPPLSQQPLQVG